VFGFLGRGAHDYFKLDDPKDPIYRGTTPVKVSGYLTDLWGADACAFIERNKQRPFFLYLAFNAVHAPLQAPADEIAKFNTGNTDRNTLLAMGKRLDDAVGKVVATLKEQGVFDNTLLFFISDNGGPLAETADNTPLRGGKHQDYEGGIRVPFLVSWPAQLQGVHEVQTPVFSLDILATSITAAGLELPKDKPLDGIDILPVLKGTAPAQPRTLYWSSGGDEGWWAIRSGDWKVVGDKAKVSLFDLSKDISEKDDLAAKMPEKVAELTKMHEAWLAPFPNPINGGGKKWGTDPTAGKKKAKSDRKKNQGEPAAKIELPKGPAAIHETLAAMPEKTWKPIHGTWEAKDGALWGTQKPDDRDAAMALPGNFQEGTIQYEVNLHGDTRHVVRFHGSDGDPIFRVEVLPQQIAVINMTAAEKGKSAKAKVNLSADTWHKVTMKFDAKELVIQVDGTQIRAGDAAVLQNKTTLDLVVVGNSVGFRNFTLAGDEKPAKP
jgi:hypothetical protein